MTEKIKPTAKTKTQLAKLYNVHIDTLTNWLKPFKKQIGETQGRIFTPKQVQTIFECLGEP